MYQPETPESKTGLEALKLLLENLKKDIKESASEFTYANKFEGELDDLLEGFIKERKPAFAAEVLKHYRSNWKYHGVPRYLYDDFRRGGDPNEAYADFLLTILDKLREDPTAIDPNIDHHALLLTTILSHTFNLKTKIQESFINAFIKKGRKIDSRELIEDVASSTMPDRDDKEEPKQYLVQKDLFFHLLSSVFPYEISSCLGLFQMALDRKDDIVFKAIFDRYFSKANQSDREYIMLELAKKINSETTFERSLMLLSTIQTSGNLEYFQKILADIREPNKQYPDMVQVKTINKVFESISFLHPTVMKILTAIEKRDLKTIKALYPTLSKLEREKYFKNLLLYAINRENLACFQFLLEEHQDIVPPYLECFKKIISTLENSRVVSDYIDVLCKTGGNPNLLENNESAILDSILSSNNARVISPLLQQISGKRINLTWEALQHYQVPFISAKTSVSTEDLKPGAELKVSYENLFYSMVTDLFKRGKYEHIDAVLSESQLQDLSVESLVAILQTMETTSQLHRGFSLKTYVALFSHSAWKGKNPSDYLEKSALEKLLIGAARTGDYLLFNLMIENGFIVSEEKLKEVLLTSIETNSNIALTLLEKTPPKVLEKFGPELFKAIVGIRRKTQEDSEQDMFLLMDMLLKKIPLDKKQGYELLIKAIKENKPFLIMQMAEQGIRLSEEELLRFLDDLLDKPNNIHAFKAILETHELSNSIKKDFLKKAIEKRNFEVASYLIKEFSSLLKEGLFSDILESAFQKEQADLVIFLLDNGIQPSKSIREFLKRVEVPVEFILDRSQKQKVSPLNLRERAKILKASSDIDEISRKRRRRYAICMTKDELKEVLEKNNCEGFQAYYRDDAGWPIQVMFVEKLDEKSLAEISKKIMFAKPSINKTALNWEIMQYQSGKIFLEELLDDVCNVLKSKETLESELENKAQIEDALAKYQGKYEVASITQKLDERGQPKGIKVIFRETLTDADRIILSNIKEQAERGLIKPLYKKFEREYKNYFDAFHLGKMGKIKKISPRRSFKVNVAKRDLTFLDLGDTNFEFLAHTVISNPAQLERVLAGDLSFSKRSPNICISLINPSASAAYNLPAETLHNNGLFSIHANLRMSPDLFESMHATSPVDISSPAPLGGQEERFKFVEELDRKRLFSFLTGAVQQAKLAESTVEIAFLPPYLIGTKPPILTPIALFQEMTKCESNLQRQKTRHNEIIASNVELTSLMVERSNLIRFLKSYESGELQSTLTKEQIQELEKSLDLLEKSKIKIYLIDTQKPVVSFTPSEELSQKRLEFIKLLTNGYNDIKFGQSAQKENKEWADQKIIRGVIKIVQALKDYRFSEWTPYPTKATITEFSDEELRKLGSENAERLLILAKGSHLPAIAAELRKAPSGFDMIKSLCTHYPGLKRLYSADSQVGEGYSIQEHTERVLKEYGERVKGFEHIEAGLPSTIRDIKQLFLLIIVMHDIGKPLDVKDAQHVHTAELIKRAFKSWGYTPEEIRLAVSLSCTDILGEFYKAAYRAKREKPEDFEANVNELVKKAVAEMKFYAEYIGMDFKTYFELQSAFYSCDALSYDSVRKVVEAQNSEDKLDLKLRAYAESVIQTVPSPIETEKEKKSDRHLHAPPT